MIEFNVISDENAMLLEKLNNAFEHDMPEYLLALINLVAAKTEEYWISEAGKTTWGSQYIKSIHRENAKTDGDYSRVWVDDKGIDLQSRKPYSMFAHMVEDGVKSWSIKDALLKSDKVKTSSKGIKYIIIPFRWRTPNNKQKSRSSFSGVIPQDIYNIIKNGGNLPNDTNQHGNMAGLKKYEKSHHSSYMTFRVITEKSTGWQHPGKTRTPVYPKVLKKAEDMIKQLIENLIQSYASDLEKRGI